MYGNLIGARAFFSMESTASNPHLILARGSSRKASGNRDEDDERRRQRRDREGHRAVKVEKRAKPSAGGSTKPQEGETFNPPAQQGPVQAKAGRRCKKNAAPAARAGTRATLWLVPGAPSSKGSD